MLGTPPAFILSQDRTLEKSLIRFQDLLAFRFAFLFTVIYCESDLSDPELLFLCISEISHLNFQGCIAVCLSRFSSVEPLIIEALELFSSLSLAATSDILPP